MKRGWVFLLLLAPLVWGLAAGDARAENRAGTFSLSPMIGGYVFDDDQDLDEGFIFGLGLGYNLTRYLGLEADLHYLKTAPDKDGGNDIDTYIYRLNALLHLRPDKVFVPYLVLGGGGISFDPDRGDSDDDGLVNYGVGYKYFFDENIATRFDVRHVYVFDDENDDNLHFSLGLVWQFGGEPAPAAAAMTIPMATPVSSPAAAPTPLPLDTDGDGVPDDRDRCPDTPRGVPVDENGCPRDSDGDGVPDYLDKCPDTPKGVAVDADGCPPDSDGDGVPDYLDKCPDTLKGMIVDETGCEVKLSLHINFDFNKAEIKPEFNDELRKAADFINRYPGVQILVAGHTDSVGTEAYNQKLSERRAAAVREALISRYGIDAGKMTSRGFGETRPVASNDTPEGRAQNRRVDVVCCTVIPD